MFLLILISRNNNHSNGQLAFDVNCQMKSVPEVFGFDSSANPRFRVNCSLFDYQGFFGYTP